MWRLKAALACGFACTLFYAATGSLALTFIAYILTLIVLAILDDERA